MTTKALASKTGQVKFLQKGEPGDIGPMVYPAGEYAADTSYTRTALSAPMVLCEGEYYALAKEGTYKGINPKTDYAANGSKATWLLMDKMRYAFIEVLMANFAKLASAVFHGQYMFSQYGVDASGSDVQTQKGYKDFNAADPMNAANRFRPNLLLDFLTGELFAKKANVSGRIETDSGKIGGFEIGSGRIGIENGQGGDANGMFLYDSMVGFNGDNMQAVIGVYPFLGTTYLGRFINRQSGLVNYGLAFDVSNASKNFAFLGKGDGVLDGLMTGYKHWHIDSGGNNVALTVNELVSTILRVSCTHDNYNVSLPTLGAVQEALGIGSSGSFCVELTVVAAISTTKSFKLRGRTSEVSGWDTQQYPLMYNQDGGIVADYIAMGKGDSIKFVLYGSSGYYAQIVNRYS